MNKKHIFKHGIIYLFHFLLTFFCCNVTEATGLKLKLIPWDSPNSPLYPGNLTPIEKLQRIIKFSHHFQSISNTNSRMNLDEIQLPLKQYNYRYSVNIRIGNPAKNVMLFVDTGSGFIWTQCTGNSNNYYPKNSRTYIPLPCKHSFCMTNKLCKCIKNQCICNQTYGSQKEKHTFVAILDTFQMPTSKRFEKPFPGILFGCSLKQPANLNLSGILGLDRSPESLLSQLRKEMKGRFSYCLRNGDSYLTLGKDISNTQGKQIKTTPIIHTGYSAFFLNLTDITVAGKRMRLSPSLFSLKNGGFTIDTGAVFTTLPKKIYYMVNNAFDRYFKGKLKRVEGKYNGVEYCYHLTPGYSDFSSIIFHFQGADLMVNRTHFINFGNVICTGFVKGSRTILGAVQQWYTRFMFDINANVLKFYRDDYCAN